MVQRMFLQTITFLLPMVMTNNLISQSIVFRNLNKNNSTLSSNFINCMEVDRNSNLWIGTEFGLNKYNLKTNQIITFNSKNSEIPFDGINSLAVDEKGALWLGSYTGEVAKIDTFGNLIEKISLYCNNPQKAIVSSIDIENNNIYISCIGCGLFKISKRADEKYILEEYYQTKNNNFTYCFAGKNGIWFSSDEGVFFWEYKGKKRYVREVDEIYCIAPSSNRYLWGVGLQGDEQVVFKIYNNKIEDIKYLSTLMLSTRVNSIVEFNDSSLLLASNIIARFSPSTIESYVFGYSDSISTDAYYSKIIMHRDYLIVSTVDKGVYIYDKNQKEKSKQEKAFFNGKKFEIGDTINIGNVLFYHQSSIPIDTINMNNLLLFLIENKTCIVEISGHTENIGSEQANMKLSSDRVEYIKEWLTFRGIRPNRVITRAYGGTHALSTENNEESRRINRRVEVKLIDCK